MSGHQSRLRDLPVPRADTEGKPFPAHQGKYNGSSSCLRCPSPMLPRSHVPASGAGTEPCLSPPCCSLAISSAQRIEPAGGRCPTPAAQIPPGASELQVALWAGIPITAGLSPLSSTLTQAPLDGFPLPKCELHAATQPDQE